MEIRGTYYTSVIIDEVGKEMATKDLIKAASVALKLIKNNSGILIGSRALEVNHEESDWDVAILKKDLPEEFHDDDKFEISKYFNLLPLGNAWLLRYPYLDIVVFEDEKDLSVLPKAISDLEKIPDYILSVKSHRCLFFEQALKHHGFVELKNEPEWVPG